MTAVVLLGISGDPAAHLAAAPDDVTGGVENKSDKAVPLRMAREAGKPVQVATTTSLLADCTDEAESDFNGDGVTDVAIADPEATVNGQAKAGLVRVSYGGTGTVKTLHEGID
ncbi:hypothetical protein [Micromonospora sp. KC721]|uniref:hypothetical protein n=1 Tax=Micromonospora sp. KC721 TaxID=2530380 RepID=UPI001FB7C183|nr:hypothetical protein [Micromonospora sp. KC721]